MEKNYSFTLILRLTLLVAGSLFTRQQSLGQSLPGPGNSLTFNGATYVNCGTGNRAITTQVSLEAWIKTTSFDYQWIAGKYLNSTLEDKGYHLYTSNGLAYINGRIGAGPNAYLSSGPSTTRVNDGRWHHIAGTTDGNTWRIYVDGVLENTGSYNYSRVDLTTSTNLSIGNYAAQSGQYFQGDIDEVRVWRTVRSAADIQQNMCRKFATAPADLVAYYRFDQSSGLVATDQGSQPTNGALVGFAGSPWHLSGAALGDASTALYQTSWPAGTQLSQAAATGDVAVVSSVSAAAQGVQLYAVNSAPSMAAGAGASSAYFGVFTAGGSGAAGYALQLQPLGGVACRAAQQRPSNDLAWSSLPTPTTSASALTYGGLAYRGEYILVSGGTGVPVSIAGDSAVCAGATGSLTASAAGATGYRWSTGATTATVGGLAPGTYSVTATFAGGCTTVAQATIRAARSYAPTISGDSILCGSGGGRLTASAAGPVTYRWNTGATTASIAVTQPGVYTVTATSAAGCSAPQASFRVRTGRVAPTFTLGADTTLCESNTLTLSGPAGVGLRYLWSDGSTGRQLTVAAAGTYSLRVSTECTTTTAARVVGQRPCLLVPNIITPNHDARNDAFVVQGLTGTDWSLDVYNRWGRAVLHTDSYRNDWGPEAAPGLYYVLLRRASTGYSYKGWVEVVP